MTRLTASDRAAHFDGLFAADPDPWGYRIRWEEEAKRRAVGGALGSGRRGRVLEIGCGNGESTRHLLHAAHRLDAIDGSATAVALAQRAVAGRPRCSVWRATLPSEFPDARFDAIIATEVLYYLGGRDLCEVLRRMKAALEPSGVLVATACLRPFPDRATGHAELFGQLRASFGQPVRSVCGGAWRLEAYRANGRQRHGSGRHR